MQSKEIVSLSVQNGSYIHSMESKAMISLHVSSEMVKGIYYCPIEIIIGLTDKGQFQYLTKLKGPQEGNYLYTTQLPSLR